MTTINTMTQTASVTDLREKFEELFDYIKRTNQPLFITKKNKPAAILVSPDYYAKISDNTKFSRTELTKLKKSINNFYDGKRSTRNKILSILK